MTDKILYNGEMKNLEVASEWKQRRKHHKRRINKKWAKRYGYVRKDLLKDDQAFVAGDTIYVSSNEFVKLTNGMSKLNKII